MFRLQSSNVLKSRIANQVVSNARTSINHSIRLNSVAIERSSSAEVGATNGSSNNYNYANTIKKVASLGKKGNGYSGKIDVHSPWYNQMMAFEDCVSQVTDPYKSCNFFWDSVSKGMQLYGELKSVPDFKDIHVEKIVRLLHNGLRANRNQLTRLAKKPDYDSKSFLSQQLFFIKSSIRDIINDLLEQNVGITEIGAMHLVTCLKELKKPEEAVSVWASCSKIPRLKNVFVAPKTVGVILPLLYASGASFEDAYELFEKVDKDERTIQPNLAVGIIKTCLEADQTAKALEMFARLSSSNFKYKSGALVESHLSFIGQCKNIAVAKKYYEKAINQEMPYKLTLQVDVVKSFMTNIYEETRDFNQVLEVWEKAIHFYGRNIHHGVSSSLNDKFFEIFFKAYGDKQAEGLIQLKQIISTYNSIKPIDEPFFNIIITKCVVWGNKEVIDSLYTGYQIYHIPKTQVSRRIYLKSLGSVQVSNEEILQSWYDLLKFADSEGATYIANADWAAIRDATVASQFSQKRDVLYAQIFKTFQYYCRDEEQLRKLKVKLLTFPFMKNIFNELDSLDASNIQVPDLQSIKAFP